jgi:hypothetical protein
MQIKDLVLAIYDKFAPTTEDEKSKVRSEINADWSSIVIDPKHENYKPGIKTYLKQYTQDPWIRALIGISFIPIFRYIVDFMNGTTKDDDDDGNDEQKIVYN